ncbi:hypothetical protein PT974_04851 [Cladobotryum mycophilum]|uniref:F-box domain-containing protein n=1 Tax=Cladobotryum mycophilum TaxID=491253 RepID=A0ABR0SQD1_9HYPO
MAFPLLQLPSEILGDIVRLFCRHCTSSGNENDASWMQSAIILRQPNYVDGSRTLAQISQTCRALCRIAQPVLFHWACAYPGQFMGMARSILSNEDLAPHVRYLRLDALSRGQLDGSGWHAQLNELELFHEYMTSFAPKDPDHEHYLAKIPPWNTPDSLFTGKRQEKLRDAFYFFILTKVTNVERIIIDSNWMTFPQQGMTTLPRLIDITFQEVTSNGVSLNHLTPLLEAAPLLKTLVVNNIREIEDKFPPQRLLRLNLSDSAISGQDLRLLMKSITGLQSFRYKSGVKRMWRASEATPRQFAEILLIQRRTLKFLSLDFGQCNYPFDLGRHLTLQHQSLKAMTALKTLVVDDVALIETLCIKNPYRDAGVNLLNFLLESPAEHKNLRRVYAAYIRGQRSSIVLHEWFAKEFTSRDVEFGILDGRNIDEAQGRWEN